MLKKFLCIIDFLFFEKKELCLFGFQSFGARSCVMLVIEALQKFFKEKNPEFKLSIKKLSPNDINGSALASAPVKSLKLIRKKAPSDIADKYIDRSGTDVVNIEMSISATRRRNLGLFGPISSKLRDRGGDVLIFDHVAFDEAVAEVQFGGRVRRIGVAGPSGDWGVIDLTNDVKLGRDGHPILDSIEHEFAAIFRQFADVL